MCLTSCSQVSCPPVHPSPWQERPQKVARYQLCKLSRPRRALQPWRAPDAHAGSHLTACDATRCSDLEFPASSYGATWSILVVKSSTIACRKSRLDVTKVQRGITETRRRACFLAAMRRERSTRVSYSEYTSQRRDYVVSGRVYAKDDVHWRSLTDIPDNEALNSACIQQWDT